MRMLGSISLLFCPINGVESFMMGHFLSFRHKVNCAVAELVSDDV